MTPSLIPHLPFPPLKAVKPGFTLTEVVLAVGLCVFCLMPLFSLLPYGLESMRTSATRQAEARIIQSIITHYQMAAWMIRHADGSRSVALEENDFFFDQSGTEVTGAGDPQRLYAVRVTFAVTGAAGAGHPYLRQAVLTISDQPDYAQAWQAGRCRQRPVWIANLEQTGPLAQTAVP